MLRRSLVLAAGRSNSRSPVALNQYPNHIAQQQEQGEEEQATGHGITMRNNREQCNINI